MSPPLGLPATYPNVRCRVPPFSEPPFKWSFLLLDLWTCQTLLFSLSVQFGPHLIDVIDVDEFALVPVSALVSPWLD